MRTIERKTFYESDGLKAKITFQESTLQLSGHVIDFTPHGLGIILDSKCDESVTSQKCLITLTHRGQKPATLTGVIVRESTISIDNKKFERIGIALLEDGKSQGQRKVERINVNEYFPATASSAHPWLYSHNILFRVTNFSPNGVGLITSLGNKLLYKGMELEIDLHLPKIGSVKTTIEIKNISAKAGVLHINALFSKRSNRIHDPICRYLLLSNGSYSPKTLKRMGFKVASSITAVFDYAVPKDFDEICKMRLLAYGRNNAQVAELDPKDLFDEFDEHSRHLVYRAHGQIVASARAIINNGKKNNSEIWGKYKAELDTEIWDEPFLEISKFCVTPDYQQTDLAVYLVNQAFRIAYETDHKYILCTSEQKLYNYYVKMGFDPIGRPIEYKEHNTELFPLRAPLEKLLKNSFAQDLRRFLGIND